MIIERPPYFLRRSFYVYTGNFCLKVVKAYGAGQAAKVDSINPLPRYAGSYDHRG